MNDCACHIVVYPHVRICTQRCYCYTKHVPLPTVLQVVVHDYLNESPAYYVGISEDLLIMPFYNIPVCVYTYQGPDRTVMELSTSSQSAIALNGYNHTSQGRVDIGMWFDGMLVDRPQELVLFQPMFGSLVPLVYDTPEYTFVSVPDPNPSMNWLDINTPHKRMLFLSAFDALNEMSNHSQSECKRRDSRNVPPPNEIDVLFVHRIDKSVQVDTSTVVLQRRYQDAQTKVSSSRILQHRVISSHTVYIGDIASCRSPVGTISKTDFIRLIVLDTTVF